MPGLRELQLQFVAAMFDQSDGAHAHAHVDRHRQADGDGDVHAHVRENGMSAGARLSIYQNNLREGFIKALALGFPVIERLGGTDYFRQLALEFLAAHPSRAGNLHHIGEPFAPFLAQKFAGTPHDYFADVAALEWVYQEAQVAADATAISADAFAHVAPEDYERLTFTFHPACRFVQSRYPIVKIWRANQPETSRAGTDRPGTGQPETDWPEASQPVSLTDAVIDLDTGGDNVLVLRTPECVEFHSLPASHFALFEALSRGENLGTALEVAEAIEVAQAGEVGFDLGAALRHLMGLNILTALHLPEPAAAYLPEI
jgi:hypothetical protein